MERIATGHHDRNNQMIHAGDLVKVGNEKTYRVEFDDTQKRWILEIGIDVDIRPLNDFGKKDLVIVG